MSCGATVAGGKSRARQARAIIGSYPALPSCSTISRVIASLIGPQCLQAQVFEV